MNTRPHQATIYRDTQGKFRGRIRSGNGKQVFMTEQGFARRTAVIERLNAWREGHRNECREMVLTDLT